MEQVKSFISYKKRNRKLNLFLADTNETVDNSNWLLSFAIWTFNFILLGGVLLRTLIHGEPYIERQSKEAALYWRQRKQADSDLTNVRNKLIT